MGSRVAERSHATNAQVRLASMRRSNARANELPGCGAATSASALSRPSRLDRVRPAGSSKLPHTHESCHAPLHPDRMHSDRKSNTAHCHVSN